MKRLLFCLSLILISLITFAQKGAPNPYDNIDKQALKLPDSLSNSIVGISGYIKENFQSDRDRIRGLYVWIAQNIAYDVASMYTIRYSEPTAISASGALQKRAGVCSDYSAIFFEACNAIGIESRIVEGYTWQNGYADYVPHAWNAARIDSSWYLFDPTWAAGYLNDYRKFVRKLNNSYFMVKPDLFIKSHMPFDYLWQFNNNPWTTDEFYNRSRIKESSRPYFNFLDTMAYFENLPYINQLEATIRRMDENGVKNAATYDRLKFYTTELNVLRQNEIVEKQNADVNAYNAAVFDYNEAMNAFNKFVVYRNNQFIPTKTDDEIRRMLEVVDSNISKAYSKIDTIENPDPTTLALINQFMQSIDHLDKELRGQQSWLNLYMSKGRSGRKSMFYKYTWFGIPLN